MATKTKAVTGQVADETVTYIVKLPASLRKTIKMLAAREGITINDFFLRSAEKEVADVVARAKP